MRILSLALLSTLVLCQAAFATPNCIDSRGLAHSSGISTPRTLTVVLYPFIPRFDAFKNEVKKRFEEKHPDIHVEILDLTDNYYGPFKKNYIGCAEADVYEIDSVFLQDFVINKKIQPLPPRTQPNPSRNI